MTNKLNIKKYIVQINNLLCMIKDEEKIFLPELEEIKLYSKEYEDLNDLKDYKHDLIDNEFQKRTGGIKTNIIIDDKMNLDNEYEGKAISDALNRMDEIMNGGDIPTVDISIVKEKEIKPVKKKKTSSGGIRPPSVDWEKLVVGKDEKSKIMSSIKSDIDNKKKHKWNIDSFVKAFYFLEDGYDGLLEIKVLDEETLSSENVFESNNSDLLEKVQKQKGLIIKVYDKKSSLSGVESFFIFLDFIALEGMLKFSKFVIIKNKLSQLQISFVTEYLDCFNIKYDNKTINNETIHRTN